MAKQRNEDKREAIMRAATRVIAAHGLSAPTAVIAKEAGVANGSLFNYFPTKADLLNQLYRELKVEMGRASMDNLPHDGDIREQVLHVWRHGLRWVAAFPEKRRAIERLGVSDEITQESREIGNRAIAPLAVLLDRSRQGGPMRDAPLGFVLSLTNALREATSDFMIREPSEADRHCKAGFEALWRMIT